MDQYLFRARTLAADSTLDEKLVTFFAVVGLLPALRTIMVPKNPDTGRSPSAGHPGRFSSGTSQPDVNVAEGVMIGTMDDRFANKVTQLKR